MSDDPKQTHARKDGHTNLKAIIEEITKSNPEEKRTLKRSAGTTDLRKYYGLKEGQERSR